ncbi:MAG: hypothetical protein ACREFE_03300, partial [Limisphaerales bacterium]
LLLLLTVLFLTALSFLITQSFDVNANERLGGTMFQTFMAILAGASILFIPLYVGVRVAAERQENNPDLLYATTLSPARIIRGKFFCGAYMAILFFSAVMPFMAFSNLLRGVDLPTIFFLLFFLFLVVCIANMIAIFLACLPMSRPFKILFALYGFFQAFGLIIPAIGISFELMRSGVGAMMAERHFWNGMLTAVAICAAVTGLFFVLAVALISPQSANRALPVRAGITTLWTFGSLLSLAWFAPTGSALPVTLWARFTFTLMIFSLLVVISNADKISLRVRRAIPKNRLKRFFAFLFFNGAAGGLIWTALISIATFFVAQEIVALGSLPKSTGFSRVMRFGLFSVGTTSGFDAFYFVNWAATMAYAFDYALLALFIQRKFFPKRPPKLAGLLAVLLAAAWALAPGIVLFFLNQLSWKSFGELQPGNIFNVFALRDDDRRIDHLYFALGWLALMILLNAKWFARQIKNFRPLEKVEPPPVIAEIPPEIPTPK